VARRNGRAVSSGEPRRGSQTTEPEIAVKLAKLIEGGAPDSMPLATALEQLRSVAGAVARLWRDLSISPPAFSAHREDRSNRVALCSLRIARVMGLSEEQAMRILRAAYLRDVGSIAIPEAILLKPGSLTAKERAAIEVHPLISCQLLSAFLSTEDLASVALAHHERFDGNGYPAGLRGVKIPLEARVLAIADSLDAMVSSRPYRDALPFSVARAQVIRRAGSQFDPNIVETLVRKGEFIRT
jgi:HD-GYP domain-containing protein (c-di-GMP phosphodiesterase class II)